MSISTSKLKRIAATTCHLAFFVFLILGIPIILFLPSPSVPPVINQIASTLFYGALAVFGGICGFGITYAIGGVVYRGVTRTDPVDDSASPSIFTFAWWCWGAFLCWGMFVGAGSKILEVRMTTNAR